MLYFEFFMYTIAPLYSCNIFYKLTSHVIHHYVIILLQKSHFNFQNAFKNKQLLFYVILEVNR